MSRAFVKEGDGPEQTLRPPLALPPGVANHITPGGLDRFRRRVEEARTERAALGDSGLDVARRAELDDELRWLEARIETFVPLAPPAHPTRVSFGCCVELEGERGRRSYRLVGVDEVEGTDISWLSPVARALMGAEEGDEVVLRTPAGEESVEVLSIDP